MMIPYMVNMDIEKSFYKEIVDAQINVGFYIRCLSDSKLMLILSHDENREFLKTNRMLFINDKFYQ